MVFSSVIFLFLFLPVTLCLYFVVGKRFRNLFLLMASLVFYAWGETFYVAVMLASIGANYLFGLALERVKGRSASKPILAAAVIFNIGLLSVFKYANFFTDNLNVLLNAVGLPTIALAPIHLPIGISFFTFQALSYVIDVYRKDAFVQRNPVNIGLYIALFPQLIAGPIVRYHDIATQILQRRTRLADFAEGVERFIIGLGKKVLIANQVAIIADKVFNLPPYSLSPAVVWLGSACFVLQVYFDFSGYSDMAIGLGRMMGFRFLENFNYPYISKSITEFWQRWHISLSTWFRDYLYIPLGGNRYGPVRTYANLITVFTLCGLWHGASWNYVIWGLSHGVFMVAERLGLGKVLKKLWFPLPHVYTMFVFTTTLTIFRAPTIPDAIGFLTVMLGLGPQGVPETAAILHLDKDILTAFIAGIVFSVPVFTPLRAVLGRLSTQSQRLAAKAVEGLALATKTVTLMLIYYVSVLFLSSGAYNPFIYFRF
jgi:alginate O-acetyltransferase complex protein AlgI